LEICPFFGDWSAGRNFPDGKEKKIKKKYSKNRNF
jgi:hypothetical protein